MTQQPDLKAWVGKTETVEDTLDLTRARAMQATLDLSERPLELGDTLPPLWHWIYFWQVAPLSGLGPDGHPARGGFLPPVALPRRMWAGGRLEFPGNLPLGRRARRRSTIQSVEEKEGRSGKLVFVTARHELSASGEPGVIEEQDIVYREAASGPYAPPPGEKPSQEADWRVTVTPTPTLRPGLRARGGGLPRPHRPWAAARHLPAAGLPARAALGKGGRLRLPRPAPHLRHRPLHRRGPQGRQALD
jgi:3-methylfumaryl-CoA hydratase